MFIDPIVNPKTCAPAERDVLAGLRDTALSVAPLEREEFFVSGAFYKHYVPTGRRTQKPCLPTTFRPQVCKLR